MADKFKAYVRDRSNEATSEILKHFQKSVEYSCKIDAEI